MQQGVGGAVETNEQQSVVLDLRPGQLPVSTVAWPQEFGTELGLILRRAHDAVTALEADARLQVSDLRVQAQLELAQMRVEAEKYAASIQADAEAYANALRTEAERYATETRELARQTAEANLNLTRELRDCWSQLASGAPVNDVPVPLPANGGPAQQRAQVNWTPKERPADVPTSGDRPFFAGLIEGEGGGIPA